MIIALFSTQGLATEAIDDLIFLEEFSERHCQLWQKAPLTPAPDITKRIALLKQDPEAPISQLQEMAVPDFSFLIPDYWPVLSWSQQRAYNHFMTAQLKTRLNLTQTTPRKESCIPQLRMIEHPEPDEEIMPKFPKIPDLQAIALMQIETTSGQLSPVLYLFDKRYPEGWKLRDIEFNNQSLIARDRLKLQSIIREQGIEAFLSYLEALTNPQTKLAN